MNLPVCPIRKVGSVHAAIIEQRGKGTSLCHGTFGSERTADGVVRLTNKRHTLDGACWWSGLVWSDLVWSCPGCPLVEEWGVPEGAKGSSGMAW